MAFVVIVNSNSSNMAELITAYYGVKLFLKMGLTEVDLELDSQIITKLIQNKEDNNNLKLKEKVDKILNQMNANAGHCLMEANQTVHSLAKYASKHAIGLHFASYQELRRMAKGLCNWTNINYIAFVYLIKKLFLVS